MIGLVSRARRNECGNTNAGDAPENYRQMPDNKTKPVSRWKNKKEGRLGFLRRLKA
jgi:hypothetical protein